MTEDHEAENVGSKMEKTNGKNGEEEEDTVAQEVALETEGPHGFESSLVVTSSVNDATLVSDSSTINLKKGKAKVKTTSGLSRKQGKKSDALSHPVHPQAPKKEQVV